MLSERLVTRMFATRLARKTTNWANCHWLGQRCRQNVLDLWTSQETLSEIHPALLIETGTNRGGAALYFAHLFDLMGHSRLLTIDVAKMHDLTHILVQDGIIDELPSFARDRPGPLPAIRRFLLQHPGFEVDHARCDRFLVTQHPMGWLRRRSNEHAA